MELAASQLSGEKKKKKPRGKPWPKGVSGNPQGMPKNTVSLVRLLRAKLKEFPKDKQGKEMALTYAEIIIQKILHRAIEGDVSILRDLIDRIDGKPVQPISGTEDKPPVHVRVSFKGKKS